MKKEINYKLREDINCFDADTESIWAEINISEKSKIIMGVLYRHPGRPISNFSEKFSKLLV